MKKQTKRFLRRFLSIFLVVLFVSLGITTASAARSSSKRPGYSTASASLVTSSPTPSPVNSNSPVDPTTGVIKNSYWKIIVSDASAASSNAVNITAALNWAANNKIQTVKLEKGTYYINGVNKNGSAEASDHGIFVPSNLTFDLNGSTLIQTTNASPSYSIVNIIKASNVTVKNGTILGDRATHDYSSVSGSHEFGYGVDIRGSSNVTVSGLTVSQMTGDAVIITGVDFYIAKGGKVCSSVTISNCDLSYCRRQGISVVGADGVVITGNKISNISGAAPESGIDLEAELDWPVNNVTIKNNTISNTADAAILFSKNSTNCTAQGNTLNGYVDLIYGKNHSIINNIINGGGIRMADTSEVYDTKIDGNTLNSSFVNCVNNQGTIITNNKVTNGYVIYAFCSGEVSGNTLNNSGNQLDYGILIYADSECGADAVYNVRFVGNTVTGNYSSKTLISSFKGLTVTTV